MAIVSWLADSLQVHEPRYLIGWDDSTGQLVIVKDDGEICRINHSKAKNLAERIMAFNPRAARR